MTREQSDKLLESVQQETAALIASNWSDIIVDLEKVKDITVSVKSELELNSTNAIHTEKLEWEVKTKHKDEGEPVVIDFQYQPDLFHQQPKG